MPDEVEPEEGGPPPVLDLDRVQLHPILVIGTEQRAREFAQRNLVNMDRLAPKLAGIYPGLFDLHVKQILQALPSLAP